MKRLLNLISLISISSIVFTLIIISIKKWHFPPIVLLIALSTIFLITVCIMLIDKKYNFLIASICLFLLTIIFLLRINAIQKDYNTFLMQRKKIDSVTGYISSFPAIKNGKTNFILRVKGVKLSNTSDYKKIKPVNILVKLKNVAQNSLEKNNVIIITKKIRLPNTSIGTFNYKEYLFNHRIYGYISVSNEDVKIIEHKIKTPTVSKILSSTLWSIRKKVLAKLKSSLSIKSYSFLLSIFFGIRSELDPEIYSMFSNTGMIHLLAISGLHIGFIGILFEKILRLFLSRSKSLFLSSIILFFYITLISNSASSSRAFVMYLTNAIFFISGIKTSGLTILSIASLILLFINPFYIFDLGYQFSFLATLGIITLKDDINEKMPVYIPKKISSTLSITIAAFLSIFLLQWSIFQKLPLFSLLSSIMLVPLFGIIFSILFFLTILFCITNIALITKTIELCIDIFLGIIRILDIIPPLSLSKIPKFIPYIFPVLLIIYFYLLSPIIMKILNNIKVLGIKKGLEMPLLKQNKGL